MVKRTKLPDVVTDGDGKEVLELFLARWSEIRAVDEFRTWVHEAKDERIVFAIEPLPSEIEALREVAPEYTWTTKETR